MGRLNLILLLIASFFFYGMLKQVGWENLEHYFHRVGYAGLLLLVPYGIMNLLTALAWQVLIVDSTHPCLWAGCFCSVWRENRLIN